jgi:electron transport complex protein RnfE
MNKREIVKNGLFKTNPLFILLLGMCPALAITNKVDNAIGMGIAVIFVLVLSNVVISLIRKIVPSEIRIPVFIVIIATFVTCISLLMQAYAYNIFVSLGIFLPLITVNCIIYGRAEAFASKNNVLDSAIDALASGGGFAMAIIMVSVVRELLGTGHITITNLFNSDMVLFSTVNMWNWLGNLINPSNHTFISDFFSKHSISILVEPVGAFLVLGFLIAIVNVIVNKTKLRKESAGVSK